MKKIYILISVLLLALIGFFAYYLMRTDTAPGGVGETLRDFLPFGAAPKDGSPNIPDPPGGRGTSDPGDFTNTGSRNPSLPFGSAGETVIFGSIRQLTTAPIAGATAWLFEEEDEQGEGQTMARYVDRETGYVYDIALSTTEPQQITNTSIPQTHEALFVEKGNGVLLRYLRENDTIATVYGSITSGASQATELENTTFLPDNVLSIGVSPSTNYIAYLVENSTDTSLVSARPDGSQADVELRTPLRELTLTWPRAGYLLAVNNPTHALPGHLYRTQGGVLEQIVRGGDGFMATMSPDGATLLNTDKERKFELFVRNLKTDVENELNLATFPEKCAWSPTESHIAYCGAPTSSLNGNMPDDWYRGAVALSDALYKIDTETELVTLVSDLTAAANARLDIINPFVGPKGEHLFFTDKNTLTLWVVRIVEDDEESIEESTSAEE